MSTQKAVIYHNAKCSKSNAALNLLLEHGIEVEIVNYLETPPSEILIGELLGKMGIEAKQLIRFGEPVAKESGLCIEDSRDREEWIALMARHPVLIERPIVVMGDEAAIGRPTEAILGMILKN